MASKNDKPTINYMKVLANTFFILGVIVPICYAVPRIQSTNLLDKMTEACTKVMEETDGDDTEKLKAVDECVARNGTYALVNTNSAYTDTYILLSTSAIFLGFLFIYNKKIKH